MRGTGAAWSFKFFVSRGGACGCHLVFNDSIKEINRVYRLKNISTFFIWYKFN